MNTLLKLFYFSGLFVFFEAQFFFDLFELFTQKKLFLLFGHPFLNLLLDLFLKLGELNLLAQQDQYFFNTLFHVKGLKHLLYLP